MHVTFVYPFFIMLLYIFFNTMAFAFGEDPNDLKKVDSCLYAFECRDGTWEIDVMYFPSSL